MSKTRSTVRAYKAREASCEMTQIDNEVMPHALTHVANVSGFYTATELARYSGLSKLCETILTWEYLSFPTNQALIHQILGGDSSPMYFSYKDRLYAAVETRQWVGDRQSPLLSTMEKMTKGKVTWGHEVNTSKKRVILAFLRSRGRKERYKDTILWIGVPRVVFSSTSSISRVMRTEPLPTLAFGGFVDDLKLVFRDCDTPKQHLWLIAEGDVSNSPALRSIFPEMVAAYQMRGTSQWRYLWDIIPGEVSFASDLCGYSDCPHSDAKSVLKKHFSDFCEEVFPKDPTCGRAQHGSVEFTYFHHDNVWVPTVLCREYRLHRLRQRRLTRLLRPFTCHLLRHLYRPGGPMFINTRATTSIGKPAQ